MGTSKLIDLIKDTKKQLLHLQTLGVEGIQVGQSAEAALETFSARTSTKTPRPAAAASPIIETERAEPKTPPNKTIHRSHISLFGDLGPAPEKLAASNETFEQIHLEVGDCTRCPLHRERTTVVHTEGNRKARLMFVGEAPGADEDIQARPFVGRAGQLLTKIVEAIGFKREEVLIGNVNRCRPPGNRPPTPEEASMCKPFLLREIAIVQPEVIVVLGNTAMKNLLETNEGITKVRGKFQEYKGIRVMPTFHPAYLLRDPSKKRETWEDLKKVRDHLDKTGQTT